MRASGIPLISDVINMDCKNKISNSIALSLEACSSGRIAASIRAIVSCGIFNGKTSMLQISSFPVNTRL